MTCSNHIISINIGCNFLSFCIYTYKYIHKYIVYIYNIMYFVSFCKRHLVLLLCPKNKCLKNRIIFLMYNGVQRSHYTGFTILSNLEYIHLLHKISYRNLHFQSRAQSSKLKYACTYSAHFVTFK